MQKKKIFLFVASVLLLLTFGCQKTIPEEEVRIYAGITLHDEQDVFIRELFQDVFHLIQKEDTLYTDLILEMQDSGGDQTRQDSQTQRFLDLQYNVICADPVDRTLAASLIQNVQKADIPVLFFNRMPVDADLGQYEKAYYLGIDAKQAAKLQAEIVLDAYRSNTESIDLNGDGIISYVILEGDRGDQNTAICTEYCVKELEAAGLQMAKAEGGIADGRRSQAKDLMERWLKQENFYVELVLSNNDEMALGALDAVQQQNISGIQIAGIGGIEEAREAVDNGQMLGTVEINKQEYAKRILNTIRAIGNGEEISQFPDTDGKYIWIMPEKYTFKP